MNEIQLLGPLAAYKYLLFSLSASMNEYEKDDSGFCFFFQIQLNDNLNIWSTVLGI
jgi:hypothetical protein